MKLTQVITINPNKKTEEVLVNLSKIANGLYNSALYENNKRYKAERKFSFYEDMCKDLKGNELYGLLASQSAQAVLQKIEGGIKSFKGVFTTSAGIALANSAAAVVLPAPSIDITTIKLFEF